MPDADHFISVVTDLRDSKMLLQSPLPIIVFIYILAVHRRMDH